MNWFIKRGDAGKETQCADVGELEDEPKIDEASLPKLYRVYAVENSDGTKALVSTNMFSPSMECLCTGTQETCDAFIEGHKLGFQNLASRPDLLIGVVETSYLQAHKVLQGLNNGTIPLSDLMVHLAIFDHLERQCSHENEKLYFGSEDAPDGDDLVERLTKSAEIIDLFGDRGSADA
ncbi:hypothetical protein [Roseibium aggregatum]|uniref:Uncharacterized protein n=1 Tax=Roseibium aggregatum TaxID=187304 RepID=A0A0M6YCU4_9HYPH|nr:hypothetical protein [Roseibium aggregatum]CTQ47323.1 hypothetical protein LAL4801_05785 [Roseibium aggregatum]